MTGERSGLSLAERAFFETKAAVLPLYEALRQRRLSKLPQTEIKPAPTQISFYDRRLFAAVSFLPVRRKKEQPIPISPPPGDWTGRRS